jgi:hypothetical protein
VKYGPGLLRVQPVQKVVLTGALTHPSHLKWWHGRVVPYDPPCPLREIILRPHDATSPWGDTFRYQFLRSYIAQHLPGVSVGVEGFGEADLSEAPPPQESAREL